MTRWVIVASLFLTACGARKPAPLTAPITPFTADCRRECLRLSQGWHDQRALDHCIERCVNIAECKDRCRTELGDDSAFRRCFDSCMEDKSR